LPINPPHVNHSNHRFLVKYPQGKPSLYMGLDQVRDLTQKTIKAIIRYRPFLSLEDFLIRVNPHKKEAQHLIMCGVLEGLTTIPQGLRRVEHQRLPGQMQLFSISPNNEDWSLNKQQLAQSKILGTSLAITPLEQYADQIQSAGAVSTLDARNRVGDSIQVAGMRQVFRRTRTRTNQMMGYLTLEDLEGSLQVLISPNLYRLHYLALRESGPFLIKGTIEKNTHHQRVRMKAEEIVLLV
jgi:DNA polymerase III subunit alpha